jgi:hypothetical protein
MIKPNKALQTLWGQLENKEAAQWQYEQLNDQCREVVNLWAGLDPQSRVRAYEEMRRG